MQKHSKKRDAILACLQDTKVHPSAEWIYARLKPSIPDLSLGTVYRNLAEFRRSGLITCVGSVNGAERFDADMTPHAHYICDCCGTVTDLSMPVLPHPSEDCGKVTGCSLVFHGVCKTCAVNK